MTNLVEKVRELEEALCQVNGKLSDIEDACEQEIIQSEEAVKLIRNFRDSDGLHESFSESATRQLLKMPQYQWLLRLCLKPLKTLQAQKILTRSRRSHLTSGKSM